MQTYSQKYMLSCHIEPNLYCTVTSNEWLNIYHTCEWHWLMQVHNHMVTVSKMQCALNCEDLLPSSTSQYSSVSTEACMEFKMLFVHLQSFLATGIKRNKSIRTALANSEILKSLKLEMKYSWVLVSPNQLANFIGFQLKLMVTKRLNTVGIFPFCFTERQQYLMTRMQTG